PIMAVQHDGTEWAAVRPICDALGIDSKSQRAKLHGKNWATGVIITSVGADGKSREMFMVDRRTLTMWLATIDTNRVSEAARPTLEAY
ncbi:phage antirepressor N-terminal domain-containing protein, partial [Klebsiella pneumoniae]|nr:phage antirepressor N-terminal domain-containing protein [Klebsiella pneumoniae]